MVRILSGSFLLAGLLAIGFCRSVSGAELPPETAATPRLPDSCLLDFSGSLERPAGKRGFLKRGENGHFIWPDGTRARFWESMSPAPV